MSRRFSASYMAFLLFVDFVVIMCSFLLSVRSVDLTGVKVGSSLSLLSPNGTMVSLFFSASGIAALWILCFLYNSIYVARYVMIWTEEYQRIVVTHSWIFLSFLGFLYLNKITASQNLFFLFYCITLCGLIGYRSLLRYWYRLQRNISNQVGRILVAGTGEVGEKLVRQLYSPDWPEQELIGFITNDAELLGNVKNIDGMRTESLVFPVLGALNEVRTVVEKYEIDSVIVALPRNAYQEVVSIVEQLNELSVGVSIVPDYFDLAFYRTTINRIGEIPLIGLREPAPDGLQLVLKRLLDIIVSLIGIAIISPLLLIIAFAIKFEDSGPIFYLANRVGQNGRLFPMYKFRSMRVDADKIQDEVSQFDSNGKLIHKVADDPRVTGIGRLIRRTSLDELPQLFNVLLGDMSLVGPRPELPWLVKEYEHWQYKRLAVPQGMTGWWQVNGRSENPMHLSTELDLYYIQNYSLWLDVQILWRTVGVVLRGRGAY